MRRMLCVTLVALSGLAAGGADYYVAPAGSDAADGSSARPWRSIQKGIDAAARPGDTLTVLPGTYAEPLTLRARGTPQKPIVIQAAQPQAVILDGARRVRGWRVLDAGQNVWGTQLAGQAPYDNDGGRWDTEPRSEQVFVAGRRCTHLKDDTPYASMSDDSFTATLTDPARYALKLPAGQNPDAANTEITVQTGLLDARAENVVLDGFVFRRAQNTYRSPGAIVTLRGEGIEFRHNLLEYSSAGSGLAILAKHSHIHHNVFRRNGQFGFSVGGSDNLIDDNLVEGNDLAGYKEWATGGTKIVGNANTIRRNRFLGNLGGVAIWLDCGPCNSVVEYNHLSGNYGEGIRAEISFHSYIGYNLVEDTRPCTPTMFGKTQAPHCIGISVQNSAETWVVHNFVKDSRGPGLQLAAYRRPAADLPQWQEHYDDAGHRQWLRQSWDAGVVYACNNRFFNNVVVQSTAEAAGPCVYLMGLTNGRQAHCFGNQFDYNFYWNSVTHAPQVQSQNRFEVPDAKSRWQTELGMDVHARGGFSAADYRQPAFAAESPYRPTESFPGRAQGRPLPDLPWRVEADYVGNTIARGHNPSMGLIEAAGSAP